MKLKTITYLSVITLLLSSCAVNVSRKAMRTTTFMPDVVRLDLTLDDFEQVGETTVTFSYNTYLGAIRVLQDINGKEVAKRNVNSVKTYGRTWLPVGPYLERALYDAQLEIREAEIFIPVSIITEQENMFLGARVKKTMKVRAFKIVN